MLHTKFRENRPAGSGEDFCGRRTDGRRTPDHGYTISSPCEPNGSGELISLLFPGFKGYPQSLS